MRCFVMFVTSVCVLFLLKLKWPKNKSFTIQAKQFSIIKHTVATQWRLDNGNVNSILTKRMTLILACSLQIS